MILTIDGQDTSALGLRIDALPNRLSPPPVDFDVHDDPTVPGVKVSTVRRSGRAFEVRGQVGPDAEVPSGNVKLALDQLSFLVGAGQPHTLVFDDGPSWFITAFGRGLIASARPSVLEEDLRLYDVSLPFLAAEPFFVETAVTTVPGIGASPTPLPAGSADIVDVIVRITGATNPVLTILDHNAQQVAQIGFTLSVGGGSFLVLDLKRSTAYVNATGNPNEGTPALGVDEFTLGAFFILRSAWWNYLTSTFATAQVSSGTAEFEYNRTYEGLPI